MAIWKIDGQIKSAWNSLHSQLNHCKYIFCVYKIAQLLQLFSVTAAVQWHCDSIRTDERFEKVFSLLHGFFQSEANQWES